MHASTQHVIQDVKNPLDCSDAEWSMDLPYPADLLTTVYYVSDSADAEPDADLNESGSREPSYQSGDFEPVSDVEEQICLPCAAPSQKDEDLKAEAKSLRHLLTHQPLNIHCHACKKAKMLRRGHHKRRVRGIKELKEAKRFGDMGTCDHWFPSNEVSKALRASPSV